MEKDILGYWDPRWGEFVEKMKGPEYCNFQEGEVGNPESITWECKHDPSMPFARKILEEMKEFDVNASIEDFKTYGAHCDCEILFNVMNPDDYVEEDQLGE